MIYHAIVKDNTDETGMGRIRVYIPDFGGDPNDELSWYVASPMSPHAANTNPYSNDAGGTSDMGSQDAYGTWATGYAIETEVVVTFLDNNHSMCVVMGGLFGQNMVNSIGGYPSAQSHQGTIRGVHPPTVEYNKRDDQINPQDPIRPVRELLTEQLMKQGLFRDFQRGQHSTSTLRDPVPQFMSVKTPRGASLVMDDGQINTDSGAGVDQRTYTHPNSPTAYQSVRSSRGAQMMINDGCGYVYMNTADGNAFMEVSDAGIVLYSAKGTAWRGKGGVSIKVDGNYFQEVKGNYNMKAMGQMGIEVDGDFKLVELGDGITWETSGKFNSKAAETTIDAQGSISKTGQVLIEDAPIIMDNTDMAGPPTEAEAPHSSAMIDRGAGGCHAKKEDESIAPSGTVTTHEPSSTHNKACGQDGGPASRDCNPTYSQTHSDGSTSRGQANPPDECGDGSNGEAGEDIPWDDHDHDHDHEEGDWLKMENQNATRNKDLSPQLKKDLSFLDEMGYDFHVTSGGETPDRRASNSGRHLWGNAADGYFVNRATGQKLNANVAADRAVLTQIVQRAKANGITGIGMGNDYMGPHVMHIGYGSPGVWGAGGKGKNAPEWLRQAYYGK